jgi:hypothetical protein
VLHAKEVVPVRDETHLAPFRVDVIDDRDRNEPVLDPARISELADQPLA